MELTEARLLLERYIGQVPGYFRQMAEEDRLTKPAPDKWSRQEILGHLIDSALNNLKRFTESQYLPQPYQVTGYRQDDLVLINWYQGKPLEHLLQLWESLNVQISHILFGLPDENRQLQIITPSGATKTLEWLMIDYVEHMRHHLRQVGME